MNDVHYSAIKSSSEAPVTVIPGLNRSIVLVGLMGAGKTTIGRRLAQRLGWTFVDTDEEIERASGMSVSEFFAKHGEAEFRAGERRVIQRLLDQPRHVMATGGGAFMNAETRQKIVEKAVSLWLRADLELLLKRTARRNTRPLLKDKDPRQVLEQLIAERYPIYAEADITVDTLDRPHGAMVEVIITALTNFARGIHI